jgi:2-oxoglutarate/2-oxoacid ferredoxin oxidoreductase subunit alpha
MVKLRAEKVERVARTIPPTEIHGDASGDLLVVGWGGTKGSIEAAVDRARKRGLKVSSIHLRHVSPLPPDLGAILSQFEHYLVPELNNGQLVRVLRDRFLLPFVPFNKIKGSPFRTSEIERAIEEVLG